MMTQGRVDKDFRSLPRLRKSCAAILTVLLLALTYAACGGPQPTPTAAPSPTPTATLTPKPAPCTLPPVAVPTPLPRPPEYLELDRTTNLHMTGIQQIMDVGGYRLEVRGMVDNPLLLSYDDLRCMPKKQVRSRLICPGFFEDTATWAGAPLDRVLEMAKVQAGATEIRLYSADKFAATLPLKEILPGNEYILAYEWEGEPLPIAHGFPVRAVLPGQTGGRWIKYLVTLEVQ